MAGCTVFLAPIQNVNISTFRLPILICKPTLEALRKMQHSKSDFEQTDFGGKSHSSPFSAIKSGSRAEKYSKSIRRQKAKIADFLQ